MFSVAKAILSYMVVKQSPLEFRINSIIGSLTESGLTNWLEDYSWFTINIAGFLPKQTKPMRYSNTYALRPLEITFFTLDHLRMAFIYYGGMLAIATCVFVIELIINGNVAEQVRMILRRLRVR